MYVCIETLQVTFESLAKASNEMLRLLTLQYSNVVGYLEPKTRAPETGESSGQNFAVKH